jgi:hypothetical protein
LAGPPLIPDLKLDDLPAATIPAAARPKPAPASSGSARPGLVATIKAGPGWATFGQVLPRGAAGKALRLGDLPTQTDVKTRWEDGSARFAVVTARVGAAGTYKLAAAPASGKAFAPKVPEASVRLRIDGVDWVAKLPARPSADRWLSGPLVTEWRAVVAPVNPSGKAHPFLRVLFDTRAYADGQARLEVVTENVLNRRGATRVVYDVTVRAGGKVLFERKGVNHWYLTRWRKVFPLGLEAAEVTPDFEPAYQAGALPRYLPVVSNEAGSPVGPQFELLQIGHLHPDMRDHGGRPELAPYPDWTARYLVHREPAQLRYLLAHADLAGSWPTHVREAEKGRWAGIGKGRLVSIAERPNFWLDGRSPPSNGVEGDMKALGMFVPDNAHVPSLAYVPYLITGDRYHADEMAFWANGGLLRTFQDTFYNARKGADGLLGANETRGIAWGLRNLADAAAYLPDNDPVRAYLAARVRTNLRWADRYADGHRTPLGTSFERKGDEGRTHQLTWMNNYVAWAIDHANRQGFHGGLRLRDRIARFQLRLFTSRDFPREYAGVSIYFVGDGTPDGPGGTRYYKDLKELFAKNFRSGQDKTTPFAGFYGVDSRLMALIGMEQNWPGAAEACRYLDGQLGTDLVRRAGWSLAPDRAPAEADTHRAAP